MRNTLRMATRMLVRCLVCGSSEVRTDEVNHRGLLLLAECPRCQHRWTEDAIPAIPAPAQARPLVRVRREVASAA
jgi:hypothetical protein